MSSNRRVRVIHHNPAGPSTATVTGPTHEIKLVPVESLQRDGDTSEDDSDVLDASSDEGEEEAEEEEEEDEVLEVVQETVIATKSHPPSQVEVGDGDNTKKRVNCLFCFKRVVKFEAKPFHRRILNNTCQRMFKHICDHLDIEFTRVPNRGLEKPPKESQLLPAYLPLCGRCREMYYNNIYESFVTYEAAVVKLADQIAACITRAIGNSAKDNAESVEEDLQKNLQEDIFDAYEKSMNEHAVMKAVRQFRQKVVEKNPAGYFEERESSPQPPKKRGGFIGKPSTNVIVTPLDPSSAAAAAPRPGPALKNVIKIVKNRTDILQRERTNELVSNRLDIVKQEMHNANEGVETTESNETPSDLNYYAVSNPAPGVIQIIPVVVGSGVGVPGSAPTVNKKRRRSEREDYQKQRIALNTCKFCNKYFPGHSFLIKHQVLKHGLEKPEKCPQCDYRGISKAALKSHLETHMDGEEKEKAKKFACHICGLRFKGKSSLNGHLRSHSGEKPFVCDVCGKAFTSITSKLLCMDKHNGVKHHKCAYCDKTFLRKEVLKIHERTHTGEKPFKCHICGKAFAQRSPLNIHLRMHKKKDPNCVIRRH